MIGINPLFPLHIDDQSIRLGNLPLTGKYIENPDNNLISFFEYICESDRTKKDLSLFFHNKGIEKNVSCKIIDELLQNEFLIEKSNYLSDVYKKNREVLFFSMFKGCDNGVKAYNNLTKKHITIIGVGAIGNIILETLARAGISNFTLIDFDTVDESNLQRQVLFNNKDINKLKVNVAKEKILEIIPTAKIKTSNINILNNQFDLDSHSDLIICTADSSVMEIRNKINKISISRQIPVVFAGFSEYMGIIGPLLIPHKTACWKCITESIGKSSRDLNHNRIIPSLGALCNVVGSILGTELIKYFTDISRCKILGQELIYDISDSTINQHKWDKIPSCPECGAKKDESY